jgi:hypothetical protein
VEQVRQCREGVERLAGAGEGAAVFAQQAAPGECRGCDGVVESLQGVVGGVQAVQCQGVQDDVVVGASREVRQLPQLPAGDRMERLRVDLPAETPGIEQGPVDIPEEESCDSRHRCILAGRRPSRRGLRLPDCLTIARRMLPPGPGPNGASPPCARHEDLVQKRLTERR